MLVGDGAGRRGGGSGNDELVSGEAGALIGLEHAVGESVGLGELEVRLDVGGVHVLELRVGRRATGRASPAADGNFVGAIHFSSVVHGYESGMCMAEVVVVGEGHGGERNSLSERVDATVGNVRSGQTVKKIVGGAVFLKDNDDVLDLLSWGRRWWGRYSSAATADESDNETACAKQGDQDKGQEYVLAAHGVTPSTPRVPFRGASLNAQADRRF